MTTEIEVSTDQARLDLDYIHGYLTRSYWAAGIPKHLVARSMRHSLCFGLYRGPQQIGFARVVTDYATFAYLADVFVDPQEQHKGYGRRFIAAVLDHERLQGLRRWHLVTKDAQAFYRKLAFSAVANPEGHMEKYTPPAYASSLPRGGQPPTGQRP